MRKQASRVYMGLSREQLKSTITRAGLCAVVSLLTWTTVVIYRLISNVVDVNNWFMWCCTLVVSFISAAVFGSCVTRVADVLHILARGPRSVVMPEHNVSVELTEEQSG